MTGALAIGSWAPARQRLAALVLLVVTLAVAATVWFGEGRGIAFAAGGWLVITALAVLWPAWIAAQVVAGQLLAASFLLGRERYSPLLAIALLGASIVVAELLAALARTDQPLDSEVAVELRLAVLAGLLGGACCAAMLLIALLPGPAGFAAVAVAAAACGAIALLLVRGRRAPGTPGSDPE